MASPTDENILDLSLEAAYPLPLALPPRLYLHAGGAYRHWDRAIDSVGAVSGLDETYRWGACRRVPVCSGAGRRANGWSRVARRVT